MKMTKEQKEIVKNAIELANSTWYDGSHGEPARYRVNSYRSVPRFQICASLNLDQFKEQLYNAIIEEQKKWLKSIKGKSKSEIAKIDNLYGMKITVGIPILDEHEVHVKFFDNYYRGNKLYADVYELGKFCCTIGRCWNGYASAKQDAHEYALKWQNGALILEHWFFPDFHNEKNVCKSQAKSMYLKNVKGVINQIIDDGYVPSEVKKATGIYDNNEFFLSKVFTPEVTASVATVEEKSEKNGEFLLWN